MAKEPVILSEEIIPPPALVRAGLESLPAIIRARGERASRRFIEFFAATIRNRNTRMAYARAVKRFFDWCDEHHLGLEDIEPIAISAYIEELSTEIAKPSVKQHLAAIRQLFDYLVTGGVLVSTPAGSVRGPKFVVSRGKTPVLSGAEMRQLLKSIDIGELMGLRDRALLGLMGYTFARVSAVVSLRVEDYFQQGRRSWLRLHEKGGKRHEVPCHHSLDEYLDAWLAAAGIGNDKKGPLFRTFKRGDKLTNNPMIRSDVLYMIKRRAKGAGLPYSTCCHTFRATGITAYLQNGGTLEHAQQIAAHQSPRTTKLMIEPKMRFRSTRSNELNSEVILESRSTSQHGIEWRLIDRLVSRARCVDYLLRTGAAAFLTRPRCARPKRARMTFQSNLLL